MLRNLPDGSLMTRSLSAPQLQGLKLKEYPSPEKRIAECGTHFPDGLGMPKSLTIRFSRASDMEQVIDLYTGARKKQIDPGNFVRPRSVEDLAFPVANGAAALAFDENGDIRASALAEHYGDGACGRKNITEIGAVLCDVGGVGLSKTLLAMLSLKQAFDPMANKRVFAKVAKENTTSNRVFSHSLQWDPVHCGQQAEGLFDVAYKKKQGLRDRLWYYFSRSAEDKAANILQTCVRDEGLKSKDGHFVEVNTDSSSLWSTLHFHAMLSRTND